MVFDDVDIDDTADKLAQAITFHTGQVCCDATRWLVHESIYDQFVESCVERLKQVVVGYQLDDDTQMGPVVSEKQRQRVLGYLQRGQAEGAEVVLEGGPAEVPDATGFYVKPALLAGSLDNVAAREEIFGPVAYLASFRDEERRSRWPTIPITGWPTASGPPTWHAPLAWPSRWWRATAGSTPTTSFRTACPTPASTRAAWEAVCL